MLNGLKTSAAILLGLLLGLILVVPLAWYGTRRGADSLVRNVQDTLTAVEGRQQALADQALTLQPLLRHFGVTHDADIFDDIQEQRSRLAGEAPLADKVKRVQYLEEVLLRSEVLYGHIARENKKLVAYEPFREHGRTWEKQKRLLVREQMELTESVAELNGLLGQWPANVLLAYKSFGAMVNGLMGDAWGNVIFVARLGLDWAGYGLRRVASLVGQQAPPEPPKWQKPKAAVTDAYLDPMAPPVFLADAPMPEDDYNELQYTHESAADYADVELGEDKAVLENRRAPGGYEAPSLVPQKTVTYNAPK